MSASPQRVDDDDAPHRPPPSSIPRTASQVRPILPLDRALRFPQQAPSYPHPPDAPPGGGGGGGDCNLLDPDSLTAPPPPPRPPIAPFPLSYPQPDAPGALHPYSLVAALRELGFRGAAAWLTRYDPELVAIALAEVQSGLDAGDVIHNPAGLVRWLVEQGSATIAAHNHPTANPSSRSAAGYRDPRTSARRQSR